MKKLILAALLITGLVSGSSGFATERQPSITLNLAFEDTTISLRTATRLFLDVASKIDVPEATVSFELPEQVSLVSGDTAWTGPLSKGETKRLSVWVQMSNEGEYTIFANASYGGQRRSRDSINIVASSEGVMPTREDFYVVKLRRARTAEEIKAIQDQPLVTEPSLAPRDKSQGEMNLDNLMMRLKKEKEEMSGEEKKSPVTDSSQEVRAADTFTVTGSAFYKDFHGDSHPIRFAVLKVVNSAGTTLATSNTNSDGSFSVSVSGTAGSTVSITIESQIMSDLIAKVIDPVTSQVHTVSSGTQTLSGTTVAFGTLATGTPVFGSTTDSISPRVFSVLDAMLQYAIVSYSLRGNNILPQLPVYFPQGTGAFYSPGATGFYLSIPRKRAFGWDVLGHEFGHFMSDKATNRFDNSPGGSHSGGSTLTSNTKSDGIKLAWSEGWATFFSIRSQIETTYSIGYTFPVIKDASGTAITGDTKYRNAEDDTIIDDLETFGGAISGDAQGYASENSIMAMLWDLADSESDSASDSSARDSVSSTLKDLYDIVNSGAYDDVGKFWIRLISGASAETIMAKAGVFAMNNIAPELTAPADNAPVSSGVSPTFTWTANGDPASSYALNNFILAISNNNFSTLAGYKEGITTNQYAFSDTDWRAVVNQANAANNTFKWLVLGYNSASPQTPASSPYFVSNVHNFQFRAYHIQLTWPLVGADVDLHLRPPGGSSTTGSYYSNDCAYYNRTPDWGRVGDTSDNPSLDRDCITTCAEENITIASVTDPGTYQIIVHYYSDHSRGPTTATVKIFQFGQLLFTGSNTLSNNQVWSAYSVQVGDAGDVRVIPTNEITTYARDLSEPTPPKKGE